MVIRPQFLHWYCCTLSLLPVLLPFTNFVPNLTSFLFPHSGHLKLFIYYTIEFISVIISIQYDKYCSELEKTMDLLKTKQSYTEEEAYYNRLAQHTYTGSANTGVGYQAIIKSAQPVDPEHERKLAQLQEYMDQHHNIRR